MNMPKMHPGAIQVKRDIQDSYPRNNPASNGSQPNNSLTFSASPVGAWHDVPVQTYTVAPPFAGNVLAKASTAPVIPSTILFG